MGYGHIVVSGFAVQALAKFLGSISRMCNEDIDDQRKADFDCR